MSVNVLDGNGNLKKIAHGFPESKFNVLRADIIENIESTDTASKNYAVGDYLIMANGQLVKVINAISEDSVITSNDVQAITVEEMIANKVDKVAGKDLSTNDYNDTDKAKVGKIDETTTHISDNPILISGLKSNQLAVNPIITLEPIQAGSGTPSPSNIRAISGYDKVEILSGNANVWDETWTLGGILWNTGVDAPATDRIRTGFIPVIDGGTYYVHKESTVSTTAIGVVFYNKAKERIAANSDISVNDTLEMRSGTAYVRFVFIGITSYSNGISINYPATETSYVPYYKTTSISESLGQTVYWGRWKPRTGEFEVLGQIIDMGDISYDYNTTLAAQGIFPFTITGKKDGGYAISSAYEVIYRDNDWIITNGQIGVRQNNIYMRICDTSCNTVEALIAKVTGQKFVYELATPFTIQLTPHEISLLKDYAYLSTNGMQIQLSYHNGELASLADVEQLSKTVEESRRSPIRLLQEDITAYTTQGNQYTAPTDGYVTLNAKTATSGAIRVNVYDSTGATLAVVNMNVGMAEQQQALFVRKGFIVRVSANSATGSQVMFRGMA